MGNQEIFNFGSKAKLTFFIISSIVETIPPGFWYSVYYTASTIFLLLGGNILGKSIVRMKLTQKLLQIEFEAYKNPKSDKEFDILKAGEAVFADFGYEGSTTFQLAQKAGVTERTLFKYFPTKFDLYKRILAGLLFATILPEHMSDLKKRLQSIESNFKTWYISTLTARYEAVVKEPNKIKLLLGAILFSQEFSEIFGKLWKTNLYEPSLEAIRFFQKRGDLREDINPEQIVRASFSLGASFLITKTILAPKHPIDPSEEISALFEIFYGGIKSRGKDTSSS